MSAQTWYACEQAGRFYGPSTVAGSLPCNANPAKILYAEGADTARIKPFQDLSAEFTRVGDTIEVTWQIDTVSLPEFKRRTANVLRQRYKVFKANVEQQVYLSDEDINAVLLLLIEDTPKDSSALLTRFYNQANFVRQKRQLFRTGKNAIQNATTYAQLMNLYNQAMDL